MKVLYKEYEADTIYLLPISDIHMGSRGADYKALNGYIEWVKEKPNRYVWLNGDIIDCATSTSTTPLTDEEMHVQKQIERAVKVFSPIKDKILGAITGNHELRPEKIMGWNAMVPICQQLGIPYLGYSAVIHLRLYNGKNKRAHKNRGDAIDYVVYAHHTTGGGGSIGGKLNRVDKLREICPNADIYLGSHNHQLGVVPVVTHFYNKRRKRIEQLRQVLIDTGGFVKWADNYSEAHQLIPTKIGSVKIRLDGLKKDVHASI